MVRVEIVREGWSEQADQRVQMRQCRCTQTDPGGQSLRFRDPDSSVNSYMGWIGKLHIYLF